MNKLLYRIFLTLFALIVPIATSAIEDKNIDKAMPCVFELVIDKNSIETPIAIRFLSDKAESFLVCKMNLEIFKQIKFHIIESVGDKEQYVFACSSFENRAVRPSSKYETLSIQKNGYLYNQKFAKDFLSFLKDVFSANDLKFETLKEFKVVIALRNIFVDDSHPKDEISSIYYEVILDKETLMYLLKCANLPAFIKTTI